MARPTADRNVRPPPDVELVEIAEYLASPLAACAEAYATARLCLLDALACGLLALRYPECTRHLGPLVPGTFVPGGARVPGTPHVLDPVKAAFDIGAMVRWLDFNDTFLAAEWGHPSDNLGAILAVSDWLSRRKAAAAEPPITVRDVLAALIQAYEVQGVLALGNAFNRVGLDHVLLVKVASTGVAARLLGATRAQTVDALSQAWVDGHSLRTYRHAPNTCSRKSWAAGDATSRGVRLALMTMAGEPGMPSALSAPRWGFCDALLHGARLVKERPYGSYVVENVLFKVSYPAEFHAQTAVECAVALHPAVRGRLDHVERVEIATQEPALGIISKAGPLHNPADRDHCLQYMVAVALLHGDLAADCYQDEFARDPRIDALRDRMTVREDPRFTAEYYDPEKRAIGNSVQVFFDDGTATEKRTVEYPMGHRRRRAEALPLLDRKLRDALEGRFAPARAESIYALCMDAEGLAATPVHELVDWLAT